MRALRHSVIHGLCRLAAVRLESVGTSSVDLADTPSAHRGQRGRSTPVTDGFLWRDAEVTYPDWTQGVGKVVMRVRG